MACGHLLVHCVVLLEGEVGEVFASHLDVCAGDRRVYFRRVRLAGLLERGLTADKGGDGFTAAERGPLVA